MKRTESERQSYLGKIQDEFAEKHITEKQHKTAHAKGLNGAAFSSRTDVRHVVQCPLWVAGGQSGGLGAPTCASED